MAGRNHATNVALPRIAITFCTQCRWMLRAAYFGQELLSTFGTSIGEVALIPTTGGIFTVKVTYNPLPAGENVASTQEPNLQEVLIWDFKTERCFPETKILKQKVRNLIEPDKALGHSDTPSSKEKSTGATGQPSGTNPSASKNDGSETRVDGADSCQDCA